MDNDQLEITRSKKNIFNQLPEFIFLCHLVCTNSTNQTKMETRNSNDKILSNIWVIGIFCLPYLSASKNLLHVSRWIYTQ